MWLITGGTGIVGAHLVAEGLARGERLRLLVREGSDRRGLERVLRHYRPDDADALDQLEFIEGDVTDVIGLAEAMEGVRQVYHAAAIVSFDPRDTGRMQEVNITGTANVVNAALSHGVDRLCHVSSIGALGHATGTPIDERTPWNADERHSAYAVSKYEAELEVQRGVAEGLDAVIANPCLIIGPGAGGRSSMTLVERVRRGTRFYPPGSTAVVDARDVAKACMDLMQREGKGERYLLSGENVTYQKLFTLLAEAFGNTPPHVRVRSSWLALAWRLERLRTLFAGGHPLVTRDTVRTSLMQRSFSNEKVRAKLGMEFRSAQEMTQNVAEFLLAQRP